MTNKIVVNSKKELEEIIISSDDGEDLNHLDVSAIIDFSFLFYSTTFNGNISEWDTSNVVDMEGCFSFSSIDCDISKWNVSNVKYAARMFANSEISCDISGFDFSNIVFIGHQNMFLNSKIPEESQIILRMKYGEL